MFGRKAAWLVVAQAAPSELAAALGLVGVRQETPDTAIAEIENNPGPPAPVLVLPPVRGWTLALITSVADQEPWNLSALSQTFGDVQRFVSHRVVEYYGWERWIDRHGPQAPEPLRQQEQPAMLRPQQAKACTTLWHSEYRLFSGPGDPLLRREPRTTIKR